LSFLEGSLHSHYFEFETESTRSKFMAGCCDKGLGNFWKRLAGKHVS